MLCALLVLGGCQAPGPAPAPLPAKKPVVVASAKVIPATEAQLLAGRVVKSGDHQGRPFLVIDKADARLYVVEADGRLRASSAVLLGSALGDESVPGIGERLIAEILPSERTTPAGRFVGERGRNHDGEALIWLDYDAAVSIHRLRPSHPAERRPARLASPESSDNRITYGCVNVPVAFFLEVVKPIFAVDNAMIYVLPERTEQPELTMGTE